GRGLGLTRPRKRAKHGGPEEHQFSQRRRRRMDTRPGRIARLCATSILVLVCGYVGSSVAGDDTQGPVRSPLSAIVVATFNSSTWFGAPLDVPIAVQGWVETKNGCFYNAGTWTIENAPLHGAVTFGDTEGPDACGTPLVYNTLFYTWTDANARFG